MPGRIFLIHWKPAEAEELAKPLRAEGWEVETEGEDGARAGKRIKERRPDAVVIYLTRLPSHGRETADGLRAYKALRDLPIVFVDGTPEAVEKTMARVPKAQYVASTELSATLRGVMKATGGSRDDAT